MMTFLAPALRCFAASARSVKRPVHSSTTSTPSAFQGSSAGSFSAMTAISLPSMMMAFSVAFTVAWPGAVHRVVLEEVRERRGLVEIVDGDELQVFLALERRAQHAAADAAKPVDGDLGGQVSISFEKVKTRGGPTGRPPCEKAADRRHGMHASQRRGSVDFRARPR